MVLLLFRLLLGRPPGVVGFVAVRLVRFASGLGSALNLSAAVLAPAVWVLSSAGIARRPVICCAMFPSDCHCSRSIAPAKAASSEARWIARTLLMGTRCSSWGSGGGIGSSCRAGAVLGLSPIFWGFRGGMSISGLHGIGLVIAAEW